MGDTDAGAAFLEPLWPGAPAISDPEKRLYEAFDVGRGGMIEMFGPGAVACGVRAALKGNFIGPKHGDPWTLPTFVLVNGDRVLWRHDGVHAGDPANFDLVLNTDRFTVNETMALILDGMQQAQDLAGRIELRPGGMIARLDD